MKQYNKMMKPITVSVILTQHIMNVYFFVDGLDGHMIHEFGIEVPFSKLFQICAMLKASE